MTGRPLRVLCWDHARCTAPMTAAAVAYGAVAPEVAVQIEVRSLADFNDQPPWQLEDGHDLVFIDHPMVGAIAARRALIPFEELLDPVELADVAAGSVHAAYASYRWSDRQWALPLDLATQVSARHEHRLTELGEAVPRTWDEVLVLAQRRPGAVALPMTAADAMCTLISLSANAHRSAGRPPHWFDADALRFLVELAALTLPAGAGVAPPRVLDDLADPESRCAYVPFVFGYAALHRGPVRFGDVPGRRGRPVGAVLGGAGVGVPAGARRPLEAARFAAWLMRRDVQEQVSVPAGAQPGSSWCWSSTTASRGGFFSATADTVSAAFTRPRDPWWPELHRRGGDLLLEELLSGTDANVIATRLVSLAEAVSDGAAALPSPAGRS